MHRKFCRRSGPLKLDMIVFESNLDFSVDSTIAVDFMMYHNNRETRGGFMKKNLTTGSVLTTVLYFSMPFILSYFLQTLYGMADLFIIGQFNGVESTTAVSIGSQVMHMLTVMIVGLAMGATVMIG